MCPMSIFFPKPQDLHIYLNVLQEPKPAQHRPSQSPSTYSSLLSPGPGSILQSPPKPRTRKPSRGALLSHTATPFILILRLFTLLDHTSEMGGRGPSP